jgi:hypothetical protein
MRWKVFSVGLVLLLLTACTDQEAKKVAQASQSVAVSLDVVFQTVKQLHEQGIISEAEKQAVLSALFDVAVVGREFNTQARQIVKLEPSSKLALLKQFKNLVESVAVLNQKVLAWQNPEARVKVGLITTSIATTLQIIYPILGGE